jgi:hypothetical protein
MADIVALYTGLKFAKDALQVALNYKIENETRTQIADALDRLGSVQDSLFEVREERIRLQNENDCLRKELADRDEWGAQERKYRVQETSGGAVVYEFTETPKHYACPSCFSNRKIQILQDDRVRRGYFTCPGCKVAYPINVANHRYPISVSRRSRSSYLDNNQW